MVAAGSAADLVGSTGSPTIVSELVELRQAQPPVGWSLVPELVEGSKGLLKQELERLPDGGR
jgi:hypothetical protein